MEKIIEESPVHECLSEAVRLLTSATDPTCPMDEYLVLVWLMDILTRVLDLQARTGSEQLRKELLTEAELFRLQVGNEFCEKEARLARLSDKARCFLYIVVMLNCALRGMDEEELPAITKIAKQVSLAQLADTEVSLIRRMFGVFS